MLQYPEINPIALQIGPVAIHWYGIMYLIGFALAWVLGRYRASKPHSVIKKDQMTDMLFYLALGVIIGGRVGYMLFYNFHTLLSDPISFFKVWEGGMSFHGGLLGVIIAMALYARKHKLAFIQLMDFIAPLAPLGLAAGRVGNFINGELWGRVTDVPWGMVYPQAGPWPRHPSVIYEFLLEGLALFIIVWWFSAKPRPRGSVSAMFLIGYGVFRFFIEFFREPDPQLGFLAFGWLTMGQLLSIPMILLGVGMFYWAFSRKA